MTGEAAWRGRQASSSILQTLPPLSLDCPCGSSWGCEVAAVASFAAAAASSPFFAAAAAAAASSPSFAAAAAAAAAAYRRPRDAQTHQNLHPRHCSVPC